MRHFDYNDLLKNYRNTYRQMYFSSSNFTKIRFRPGGPRWGAYDAPPDPVVGWGGGHLSPIPSPRRLRRLLDAYLDAFGVSISPPSAPRFPILNRAIRLSYLPHDFKSLDELLDSADYPLFNQISRNPLHVLNPLLFLRKRTVYNLRKLTHGLTIPLVSSSLMRKYFVIRMLYADVY